MRGCSVICIFLFFNLTGVYSYGQSDAKGFAKVVNDTANIRKIAAYLIGNRMVDDFKGGQKIIEVRDLRNAKIRKYCRRLKIGIIYIQGDKWLADGIGPQKRVIILYRKRVPLFSDHREIVIDCSESGIKYPDIESAQVSFHRITEDIYYIKSY